MSETEGDECDEDDKDRPDNMTGRKAERGNAEQRTQSAKQHGRSNRPKRLLHSGLPVVFRALDVPQEDVIRIVNNQTNAENHANVRDRVDVEPGKLNHCNKR